jgi:LacI family transcriptional regulator/LacI family asc operon transcriptional repressor
MNIRQIAALCGVSVATVSRVLNSSPKVSPETRAKVLGVMEREAYVPNAFASGFGRNALKIVGILCADIANLYYARAVSLLERALRARGYDALLYCTGYGQQEKKVALQQLIRKRVDAVLLVGSAYREQRDNAHLRDTARQVPVFLVNAEVQIPNVYCVFCDEREALRNAVTALGGTGARRVLYLHDMRAWAWAGTQKLTGYWDGVKDGGLAQDPNLVQVVACDVEAARGRVAELLAEGLAFDGVVASEDIIAVGAQKAAGALGKPIIGFNNSQLALCCTPALTSVDNMLGDICPLAVEMLDKILAGGSVPAKVVVSATLAERETFKRKGDA